MKSLHGRTCDDSEYSELLSRRDDPFQDHADKLQGVCVKDESGAKYITARRPMASVVVWVTRSGIRTAIGAHVGNVVRKARRESDIALVKQAAGRDQVFSTDIARCGKHRPREAFQRTLSTFSTLKMHRIVHDEHAFERSCGRKHC